MKQTKLFYAGIIFVLLAVITVLVWNFWSALPWGKQSYYAVRLTSGEIWFGELSRFPVFSLKNAHTLQSRKDGAIDVVPLTAAAWGPTGTLRLNDKNISWIAELRSDSQVVQLINKEAK